MQTELQRQLASDPVTAPAHLTVTVDQGVARISGDIDTPAQQARAIEIARAVKGVIVAEPDMRLSDQGLARSVQQAIAADPDVGQVPLTVEATDGRVRLVSDQTNADQRAKLVEIAKGVEGVTAVEDRMR